MFGCWELVIGRYLFSGSGVQSTTLTVKCDRRRGEGEKQLTLRPRRGGGVPNDSRGEGGRVGLRPAAWESGTLTHKPPMRLFVGLWARVPLSHPRDARATALQRR